MKKIISLFIVFSLLVGCSTPVSTVVDLDTYVDTEYEYVQPLNILRDNYRNCYIVNPASFADSDGNGKGDLTGLTFNLKYIADLGCNGVYVTNILENTDGFITEYMSVDGDYGVLADLQGMLMEASMYNIATILEMDFSCTSIAHPWFESAANSIKNGITGDIFTTYYTFVKGDPNNKDYYNIESTDYWYLAPNGKNAPQLNLHNENLRSDLEYILNYWVEQGIGGFAFTNVEDYVYVDSDDEAVLKDAKTSTNDILIWLTDYCKRISPDSYLIADADTDFATATSYYLSGIDTVMNYGFAGEDGRIVKTVNNIDSIDVYGESLMYAQELFKLCSTHAIGGNFFSGYTRESSMSWLSGDILKIKYAIGLNAMIGGTTFISANEELCVSSSGDALLDWQEVANEIEEPSSIYNYTKLALRIRNENPEIARGEVSLNENIDNEEILVFYKVYDGKTVAIIINNSPNVNILESVTNTVGVSNFRGYLSPTGNGVIYEKDTLTLPPYSISIMNSDVQEVEEE